MRAFFLWLLLCSTTCAATLRVGEGEPYSRIAAALAAAADGDAVLIGPGTYRESGLVVDRRIRLQGRGWPIIDAGKTAQGITVVASGASISGLVVRNGGFSALDDPAGIRVTGAERVEIRGNRIEQCAFGVFFENAKDGLIAGNRIVTSRGDEHNSGNGIHLWYCERITVENNRVIGHRDGIYLEFVGESRITGNSVDDCPRYGLHFMFSHDDHYERNRFTNNGAGVAVMYSKRVTMRANRFDRNWGDSAYGLLLKSISDSELEDNLVEGNTVGVLLDDVTRMRIAGNRFASNGRALQIVTNSGDCEIAGNLFSGNSFDVTAAGKLNGFVIAGNYWDSYGGYDLDRDGAGDVPHRPVRLFGVVIERESAALLLLRSPVVHLLDQIERAFPTLTPETLVDSAPAMRPPSLDLGETPPPREPHAAAPPRSAGSHDLH